MNKKIVFFIFLFVIIIALFSALYLIGYLNYIQWNFNEELDWLEFNSKRISIVYLIVLSIFFILAVAIMIRIILSSKEEKSGLTAMNIDEFSIKRDETENFTQSFEKIITSLNKNLHAIQKFTDIIDSDLEKVDNVKLDNIIKEKIDVLFQNFSQMINDFLESNTVSELFEKILYWGVSFSNSKRGSIMVVDKNKELYIYKTIGWTQKENIDKIKIHLGEGIAGKVASENKRIFVTNIENYENHDFKYKDHYETKSFISLPIFGIKKVVAVLNLTENKNGLYSMNDLEIINVITKLSSKVFEIIQIKKKIIL